MLIAMRKLGHKKKNNLGWIQSLFCQQEAWKKSSIIFHQFNGSKRKKMITLNQTKQKQANEVDGHEALHI